MVIDPNDVTGSWKTWLDEFEIYVELKEVEMGTKTLQVEGERREVALFTPRNKLLTLLKAIGKEGRDALRAKGVEGSSIEVTYDAVLEVLKEHYKREETVFVRMQKFMTVSQVVGEDYRDYLLRVEGLGRDCGAFERRNDAQINEALSGARELVCLAAAVNGLRDSTLRRELLAKPDLTWTTLGQILRGRSTANEAAKHFESGSVTREPQVAIKQEVNEVRSRRRNSTPVRSWEHENSDGAFGYSRQSRFRRRSSSPSRGYRSRDSSFDRRINRDFSSDRYRRSPSRDSDMGGRSRVRFNSRERSKYNYGDADDRLRCFKCGVEGHIARNCPDDWCRNCDRRGHVSGDCRDRPRTEFAGGRVPYR